MSFPKSGNMLPKRRRGKPRKPSFARLVATALRTALKGQSSKIKTVARWTGANERTVKNWLSGERAPSGDHFLGLAANCPGVLAAFLAAIHRNDCLVMADIEEARAKVAAALIALEAVRAVQLEGSQPPTQDFRTTGAAVLDSKSPFLAKPKPEASARPEG